MTPIAKSRSMSCEIANAISDSSGDSSSICGDRPGYKKKMKPDLKLIYLCHSPKVSRLEAMTESIYECSASSVAIFYGLLIGPHSSRMAWY